MLNCDKCGERLKRNAKFCSSCGDTVIWPELNYDEKINEFSDYIVEKGNEFLDDNLPEEYADKVKENISNFHQTTKNPDRSFIDENEKLSNAKESIINTSKSIKKSSSDFIQNNEGLNSAKNVVVDVSGSVKESGSQFINNNVSYSTQHKIKSNFDNLSTSTRKFASDTSNVLKNIHNHRSKVNEQKRQEKEAEKEALSKKSDEEWIEKQKQLKKELKEKHEKAIIDIRENRTVNIEFPIKTDTDNVATGALKGEMMGSALGRATEGFFGDDSLSSTLNAGLVLGGAGALIGGLAAASDDGIRWQDAMLFIADDELIISGKYALSFDDIKLVNTAKLKNSQIVVLTLKDRGIEFRTEDAKALKIVIDEYMQNYFANKRKPSNVDELLKYGELYEKGVITKEELDEKKKELL